jgi:lipoprotein-releasing system ATP-binding protein
MAMKHRDFDLLKVMNFHVPGEGARVFCKMRENRSSARHYVSPSVIAIPAFPIFHPPRTTILPANHYLCRPGNAKTMIKIENIKKSYGNLQVLKGIDLFIREKEVVTIVGPSGAGKSTLLHILGTLDTPDEGEVRYGTVEVSRLSSDKLSAFRNENIGLVFQHHRLLPEFTALENTCIPAWIKGKSRREAERKARELLSLLGLSARLDHKPGQLSGGEQQRVAVARALVNDPRVVLADEPSGNLDSRNKSELHDLFFTLRERLGQTFVIVTHDPALARMSDRQVHLRDGLIERP